jgi:predicted alpha-1,2-mannosidase
MKQLFLILSIIVLAVSSCSTAEKTDLTSKVDVFIGTLPHGHVFPGATTPFGMVQMSPDNGTDGWDWCSGYNYSDTVIAGFSHTHLSGTGIGDLCDILFLPSMTAINTSLPNPGESVAKINRSSFSHKNEKAHPGYYSVVLDNGVIVELTATPRCGIQRYTACRDGVMSVVVDLGFAINWDRPDSCSLNWDGSSLSGSRISSGWAKKQYEFFASQFSKAPVTVSMYSEGTLVNDKNAAGKNIFCILSFDMKNDESLMVKTGISAVDIDGAANNLKTEAAEWDFTAKSAEAMAAWQKALGVIKASSADAGTEKVFYTALYHSMIAPNLYNDADNRYRGTDGKIHTAKGFNNYTVFSLWDTYRAEHPLFTIIAPERIPDFINTFINIYKEQGKLPAWSLDGNETDCMVGYHSVPVIADAIHKKFKGFDYNQAWEASVHSSNLDFMGLKLFNEYGYIPSELENQSVSKTLEYSIDAWCMYQMAMDLGKKVDADLYLGRSKSYKNVFDPELKFVRGKMKDGTWRGEFDPLYSNHEQSDFTEGNAWQYTWLVPQDVDGLASLFGSKEMFLSRLDSLFNIKEAVRGENASADISGLIGQYAQGNEPSHHIAYLFAMEGQPEKTQYFVKKIMNDLYTDKKDGLCGNEDCGQMSAWYVLSAMGIYPVNPADGKFILGCPSLDKASISVPGGKSFNIVAVNNSRDKYKVKDVLLNNKHLDRSYITYDEIMAGGELKFIME